MSTTPRPQPRLCGVHHVKLPVADVHASRDWYCRRARLPARTGLRRGRHAHGCRPVPPGSLRLALRCDRDRTAALAGFDPLALAVPGRAELDAWLAHLDALACPTGR